jgi:hypothetical protein
LIDPRVDLIVCRLSIGVKNMKRPFVICLSTAAICAFTAATPAVAQETIMGAPKGTAPITAEPPNTPSHGLGNRYDDDPFAALGGILAPPLDATTSNPADTTAPKARCRVILDFNNSEARPTTVCGP